MRYGPHNERRMLFIRRIETDRRIVDYLEESGLVLSQRKKYDRRRALRRGDVTDRRLGNCMYREPVQHVISL